MAIQLLPPSALTLEGSTYTRELEALKGGMVLATCTPYFSGVTLDLCLFQILLFLLSAFISSNTTRHVHYFAGALRRS